MMVMSIDEGFHYLSPSFAVLDVECSQIRIEGYKATWDAENYDYLVCEYTKFPPYMYVRRVQERYGAQSIF